MNKTELVQAVADNAGVSKRVAETVLNAFTEVVKGAVAGGDKVSLIGFGSFARAVRKARSGRNPSTGNPIDIPERNVPKFTAGKEFKDQVK